MDNPFINLALRKRAEIPIYSFAKHAREQETTSIYSPHVLILEGIFALYDPRVLELLDMKVLVIAFPHLDLISPANVSL
jgi:uridine kinase